MFWLTRPAYGRWVAAALVLVVAAAFDLAGQATEPYPFITTAIPSGAAVTEADVEWRDVPAGLLPSAPDLDGAAVTDLAPGEPITPAAVTTGRTVPSGWWSVPLDLPEGAAVGTPVRLVAVDPPLDAEGVVARPPTTGAFSLGTPGLVAVPPDSAASVARAAATGSLVVLLGT